MRPLLAYAGNEPLAGAVRAALEAETVAYSPARHTAPGSRRVECSLQVIGS
jgi:hypothetical protein